MDHVYLHSFRSYEINTILYIIYIYIYVPVLRVSGPPPMVWSPTPWYHVVVVVLLYNSSGSSTVITTA